MTPNDIWVDLTVSQCTYDANNRLDTATPPDLDPNAGVARGVPDQSAGGDYGYDWVGNRLSPPAGANAMQYNKADQLTLWPGMYSHTYYPDGSMQYVKNPSGSTTLRSYTYTPAGLLASASYVGRTLANTWDADSNRVAMGANGSEYAFVYDTTAGVPAVIAEVQPDESVVYYYREPDGSLIARRDGSDWRYYHFDALGSTRLITDSQGYVTDAYAYDAYGALLSHDRYSGSIDQPYQYVGRHGYYTHYQEPDFGLLQLGVRFYDPTIGRFTQIDPARDGVNWYAYVECRPLRLTDPYGRRGGDTDCPDCRRRYNQCISRALARFRSCVVETIGIADVAGVAHMIDQHERGKLALDAACSSARQLTSKNLLALW